MRPCLVCGEPSPAPRCTQHRARDTRVRKGRGEAAYDTTWRRLSIRARRDSPFCLDCGAVDDLTSDHLLPKVDYPELVHAIENIAVRCRPCNSRRGTVFAVADAQEVLARLTATHQHHPTLRSRLRIAAAQRAIQTRGVTPPPLPHRPTGEAKFELLTLEAVPAGGDEVVAAS